MSETTNQPHGGGKSYGYQAPTETAAVGGSVAAKKRAVVSAFDDFLDALAGQVGGGTAPASPPPTSGGAPSGGYTPSSGDVAGAAGSGHYGSAGSSSSTPGAGATGGSPVGGPAAGNSAAGSSAAGSSSAPGYTAPTGSPASSGSSASSESSASGSGAGSEAYEMSLFSQREAFRIDRSRESGRRAQRRRRTEAQPAADATNPHLADCNRAPLTDQREFGPAFGAAGRPTTRTAEVIAKPTVKRPTTVPESGLVSGVRPIDAYWASYGNAVERAAARARVDSVMLESIIGTDERRRVTNTTEYPWRCICSLLITASTGAVYLGTAWLVAPRLLLTAGHCVYMADEGGWVRQIEVIPGRDAANRPYGSAVASDFRSVTGWTRDGDSEYDYAGIILPDGNRFGDQLGWFGYASRADDYLEGITVNVSGYPGDGGPAHADGTQWFDSRTIDEVDDRQVHYVADTYGGQSGAPVWETTSDGSRYGVAIHTFGTSVQNGGTRITGDVFDNIVAWAGDAP
ncbi:MAG: trypsin-like serine peptidase [Candidatus Nanopelagicales bacterium]